MRIGGISIYSVENVRENLSVVELLHPESEQLRLQLLSLTFAFAPTTWYIGNPAIRPERAYITCRLACEGTPLHSPITSTREGRLGAAVVLCAA